MVSRRGHRRYLFGHRCYFFTCFIFSAIILGVVLVLLVLLVLLLRPPSPRVR